MSIPSIVEMAGVFDNPGTALRYLVLHGVLEVPENCSRPACEGRMRVSNLLKPYLYHCSRKRTCGMSLSIYKDTFFGSTRVPANKVLLIAYLWLTKYNRGHRVEGVWVVGGVEITLERRMFAVSVQDRSADTLRAIIQEHVLPGTIVRTDLWRGYRALNDFGMEHQTVNHTEHFVDHVMLMLMLKMPRMFIRITLIKFF